MSQFLVLRLADPVSWIITDADGGRIGPVSTGSLADAAPLAAERPLVVIAPGASVTFAQPELPVKGGARLAQVVPYAMEELLAGEVEQFHFAVGRTDAERPHTGRSRAARRIAQLAGCAQVGRTRSAGPRARTALRAGQSRQDRCRNRRGPAAGARARRAAGGARRGATDRGLCIGGPRGRGPSRAALSSRNRTGSIRAR